MLILGLDTATLACSVALLEGKTLLAEMTVNRKKTHSERLMPQIDRLLKECALEREALAGIAVAAGPGSFTGLRIGVATARALAQGLKIPAVSVCTLEALAAAVPTPGALICPLLDARRQQVYTALYRRSTAQPDQLETLIEPGAYALAELYPRWQATNEPIFFCGEGLHSYESEIINQLPAGQALIAPAPFRHCRAALVAYCGQRLLQANPGASYEDLLPIYLRRPEAERLAAEKETGARAAKEEGA